MQTFHVSTITQIYLTHNLNGAELLYSKIILKIVLVLATLSHFNFLLLLMIKIILNHLYRNPFF